MAYHSSVDQMIMAVGVGQLPQTLESRTDRQAHLLVDHSAHYRAEAASAFAQMRRTQDLAARAFPSLGVVALLLTGVCLRLMAVQRRRLTVLRSEAQTQAVTDELTGLANRAGLYSALRHALPRAAPNRMLGLLLLDLNGFKAVNDSYGHELGDDVLKVLAERLRNTVPDSAFVARLGGDEFVVLLPDAAHQAEVDRVASEVWPALSTPTIVRSVVVNIGASIGIAVTAGSSDDHGTAASELLRRADIAMYASKKAKRGPVLFSSIAAGDALAHRGASDHETR